MSTQELPRDFKGIWIPRDIWEHPELSWSEKILAAEIDSLDSDDGCFASNEYFCKMLGLQERQIQNIFLKLKRLNLMQVIRFDGRTTWRRGYTKIRFNASQTCNENAPQGCKKLHPSDAKNCIPPTKNIHIQNERKEESKDNSSHNLRSRHQKTPAFSFSTDSKFTGITDLDKEGWRKAFPCIDIDQTILQAEQWVIANPGRKKKNWRRFLTTWFSRANDREESRQNFRDAKSDNPIAKQLQIKRQNLDLFLKEKEENEESGVLNHLVHRGDYIVNLENSKEISLMTTDPSIFLKRLMHIGDLEAENEI